MKFLVPVGGVIDENFGVLTSPATRGIAAGISSGLAWAADNQAYTQGFDPQKYFPWLETHLPYQDTYLFVAVPDVVGNAQATLQNYYSWRPLFDSWPVAFVGQDGSEPTDIPASATTLFVGGTTDWKESADAITMIRAAQDRGMHIHIGRVNWGRRYKLFSVLKGSENFTCDGTRTRYEGTEKSLKAWKGYNDQPPLITI